MDLCYTKTKSQFLSQSTSREINFLAFSTVVLAQVSAGQDQMRWEAFCFRLIYSNLSQCLLLTLQHCSFTATPVCLIEVRFLCVFLLMCRMLTSLERDHILSGNVQPLLNLCLKLAQPLFEASLTCFQTTITPSLCLQKVSFFEWFVVLCYI